VLGQTQSLRPVIVQLRAACYLPGADVMLSRMRFPLKPRMRCSGAGLACIHRVIHRFHVEVHDLAQNWEAHGRIHRHA
jgi:hypothetical protein